MSSNTSPPRASFITRFYGEGARDFRNRTLADILGYDDRALERKHDYIQILFPLPEGSTFNMEAPLVTYATREEFLASAELRGQLFKAFVRLASFYGFDIFVDGAEYKFISKPSVSPSDTWLKSRDHNHLRITRIIRCLRVLGLEPLALAFHDALVQTDAGRRVSKTSLMFWDRAANRALHLPPDESNEGATGIVWLRDVVPT